MPMAPLIFPPRRSFFSNYVFIGSKTLSASKGGSESRHWGGNRQLRHNPRGPYNTNFTRCANDNKCTLNSYGDGNGEFSTSQVQDGEALHQNLEFDRPTDITQTSTKKIYNLIETHLLYWVLLVRTITNTIIYICSFLILYSDIGCNNNADMPTVQPKKAIDQSWLILDDDHARFFLRTCLDPERHRDEHPVRQLRFNGNPRSFLPFLLLLILHSFECNNTSLKFKTKIQTQPQPHLFLQASSLRSDPYHTHILFKPSVVFITNSIQQKIPQKIP